MRRSLLHYGLFGVMVAAFAYAALTLLPLSTPEWLKLTVLGCLSVVAAALIDWLVPRSNLPNSKIG